MLLPEVVAGQGPQCGQVAGHQLDGSLPTCWQRFAASTQVLGQRPEPGAQAIGLIGPIPGAGLAVDSVAGVQIVSAQRLTSPRLFDGPLDRGCLAQRGTRHPAVEGARAGVLARQVQCVGCKGAVAEPAVMIGGKGGTGQVGPAGGLVGLHRLDAVLVQVGHGLPQRHPDKSGTPDSPTCWGCASLRLCPDTHPPAPPRSRTNSPGGAGSW